MKLHERLHLYVIEVFFYEISQLRHIHLDQALIGRWRCKMRTFHLFVGKITQTLQDVVMLTSLLTDETLMTSYGGSIDRDTLCDRL